MTIEDINLRLKQIDSRVASIEKIQDAYTASHGEMNNGLYEKVQDLMDERERLFRQRQKLYQQERLNDTMLYQK